MQKRYCANFGKFILKLLCTKSLTGCQHQDEFPKIRAISFLQLLSFVNDNSKNNKSYQNGNYLRIFLGRYFCQRPGYGKCVILKPLSYLPTVNLFSCNIFIFKQSARICYSRCCAFVLFYFSQLETLHFSIPVFPFL